MNKHIGKVFDGRWKVVNFHRYSNSHSNGSYVLQNIFNDEVISVSGNYFRKILSGEKTVNDYRKEMMRRITSHSRFVKRMEYRLRKEDY